MRQPNRMPNLNIRSIVRDRRKAPAARVCGTAPTRFSREQSRSATYRSYPFASKIPSGTKVRGRYPRSVLRCLIETFSSGWNSSAHALDPLCGPPKYFGLADMVSVRPASVGESESGTLQIRCVEPAQVTVFDLIGEHADRCPDVVATHQP